MKTTYKFSVLILAALAAAPAALGQLVESGGLPAYVARRLNVSLYVPGEVLVQFHSTAPASQTGRLLAQLRTSAKESILTGPMQDRGESPVLVLQISGSVEDAVKRLSADPSVAYAEPNWQYFHFATSNDPYYTGGQLWGMYGDATSPANAFGSQAGEAWANNHTGSAGVYVGIIDEGFMINHADLAANVWVNPFDPVDGIDNDGNGYIDDRNGWDFNGNNSSVYDGRSDDHGTHVAGTIGAVGGNGVGVAGMNWSVRMISCKFLGASGGTTANAIKAIDYLTDLKTRHGLNLVATNNSWGGGGFSSLLQAAIERANAAEILFCAAAGNGGSDGVGDNNDTTPNYPSNYPNANVIAVASITSSGARSSFSNYGATTVDIAAPGSGIYSTLPGNGNRSTYGSYSGTSMATPHVTGAAALYSAYHPGSSAAAIKAAILNSAVPTASMAGRCVTGGRLDVSGF